MAVNIWVALYGIVSLRTSRPPDHPCPRRDADRRRPGRPKPGWTTQHNHPSGTAPTAGSSHRRSEQIGGSRTPWVASCDGGKTEDRHLPDRLAAGQMQAAMKASGAGDDAPGLAISPRLDAGLRSGRHADTGRSFGPVVEAADVGDSVAAQVRTCQRWAVPPASRAAGVPVTSSSTRSVPGWRSPQ